MPGSGTSTFIDPDDYQASLNRVPLDLLLVTSRGEFKASVTSARLNHLYLLRSEDRQGSAPGALALIRHRSCSSTTADE